MDKLNSNQLADQPSAYLRQHRDNPVHWQPWNAQSLQAAASQNKPILLSIGYAACHWCHVMAHESFEDPRIAEVMNALFINIKVDREERPDIDQIYMAALTSMGQQGGWPLTVFLKPDGKAFWGGTYFPPSRRYDMPAFIDVLHFIHNLWVNDQDKINHNAEAVFTHLQKRLATPGDAVDTDPLQLFARVSDAVAQHMDPVRGGMAGAPKFPNAPLLEMLWLSWLYTGKQDHRDLFLVSLRQMLQGGIFDHLGGGLSRYSTDADWLAPHFEKMLYDNSFLIRHANWAYAATRDELFKGRTEQTVNWLLRELKLPDGSFASSLDADSEGQEGKYYVWTAKEIDEALGPQAQRLKEYFQVSPAGNWEGLNILNRLHASDAAEVANPELINASATLLSRRQLRTAPARDDKALTEWNGFAIRALAEAGRSFDRTDWIEAAAAAYRSIQATSSAGRLAHCRMDNHCVYPCLSSDYAAMINAALALYSATGETRYIADATALKQALDLWHRDDNGDYRLTASDAQDVILRSYGDQDEAIPSATSQIVEALTRLSLLTDDASQPATLSELIARSLARSQNQQFGQIGIINGARMAAKPYSLVLSVEPADVEFGAVPASFPDPRRLDIVLPYRHNKFISLPGGGIAELRRSTAWLCKGNACLPPVHEASDLKQLLTKQI